MDEGEGGVLRRSLAFDHILKVTPSTSNTWLYDTTIAIIIDAAIVAAAAAVGCLGIWAVAVRQAYSLLCSV
jgi:hypothetical protein